MITRPVLVRRTTRRRHGDPGPVAEHTIHGAFAPRSRAGDGPSGSASSDIEGVLYVPDYGADLLAGDRVVVDGREFDVVGHPARWRNPFTGSEPGLEAALKGTP